MPARPVVIVGPSGKASCLVGRLSSNVRPHSCTVAAHRRHMRMCGRAMSEVPHSISEPGPAMNARGCYCNLWRTKPETLRLQGIPEGYCGICERCGVPGHTRHHPGGVPYTGEWCDRIVHLKSVFLTPMGWVKLLLVGAGLYALFFVGALVVTAVWALIRSAWSALQ